MINTEDRLYDLAIQLLPYVGIQDMEAPCIHEQSDSRIINKGMKVSGMWILWA